MEQLRAFTVTEKYENKDRWFEVREKDMDDSICYDILMDGIYLLTISPTGKVLFNSDSNKMSPEEMRDLIENIKQQI